MKNSRKTVNSTRSATNETGEKYGKEIHSKNTIYKLCIVYGNWDGPRYTARKVNRTLPMESGSMTPTLSFARQFFTNSPHKREPHRLWFIAMLQNSAIQRFQQAYSCEPHNEGRKLISQVRTAGSNKLCELHGSLWFGIQISDSQNFILSKIS